MEELLKIENLSVGIHSPAGKVQAVRDVTFALHPGEVLAIVGESGCGKSILCKSIMKLLPKSAKIEGGKIIAKGADITKYSDRDMRKLRGKLFSFVFQDPMTALNPVKTVVDQIAEGIHLHQGLDKAASTRAAIKMLETVGISEDRAHEYPHQFSGGMKQRVVIAIALACNPQLLIADEPTTALDVTIQAQVLDLIKALQKDMGTSMILITHDLGVVAETCDNVAVVYAGELVEYGTKEQVYDDHSHPYTVGLFGAVPDLTKNVRRLSPVEGLPPDPTDLPPGCSFAPRCPHATEECTKAHVEMVERSPGHYVRCLKCQKKEG